MPNCKNGAICLHYYLKVHTECNLAFIPLFVEPGSLHLQKFVWWELLNKSLEFHYALMVSNVKPLPGSLGLHPRQSDGPVYWFRWLGLMFQLRLIMEIFICHQKRSFWELKIFSVMFSSFLLVVDLSIMTDESTFILLFFVEERLW